MNSNKNKYISNDIFLKIINNTPKYNKIYNKFDTSYFFIISKNDFQAPFEMYKDYILNNLYIFEKKKHSQLTTTPDKDVIHLLFKIVKLLQNEYR